MLHRLLLVAQLDIHVLLFRQFFLFTPPGIAKPRGVAVAKSKYDRNKQVKFVILALERLLLASWKRGENTEDRISRRDAFHFS